MKKIIVALIAISMMLVTTTAVLSAPPGCTTIQSGGISASDGTVITVGYDDWGYNYQAHMFNGYYCDAYRNAEWCQPYCDIRLIMKWNDAWLSNKDCDGDGKLDRHYGFGSYIGSGAWLTNYQAGTYIGDDENEHSWNYFVKIVAVPSDAILVDGIWYLNGIEMGPVIWGQFAIIQEVSNDPYAEETGIYYNAPAPTGFGYY